RGVARALPSRAATGRRDPRRGGGDPMERARYLILGGGVSGLSLVNWLDSEDYLVLEAEEALGGYCRTVTPCGVGWDYSGHFFHFKDPEIERYLIERMGDQRVRTVVKDSRIRHGDALIDFPFQKNIHQLPKEELLDCLYDLFFKEGAGAGAPANFQ